MTCACIAIMVVLASEGPSYTAGSIVNAAGNLPGALAPNTIATIYGTGLAFTTRAIAADDIHGGTLPTVLPSTGVRVSVGGILANIYYVSPSQINILVPASLLPGPSDLQVVLDGRAGPLVSIQLDSASPGLFLLDGVNAVATRLDGSVVTPDNPSHPGDIVVLYATGLGETVPPAVYSQVAREAAVLRDVASFQVMLGGTTVDPRLVFYAGVAPGFAGLYQINCRLPDSTGANPEIRVAVGSRVSAIGVTLPVRP